jgi:hypothetical protein
LFSTEKETTRLQRGLHLHTRRLAQPEYPFYGPSLIRPHAKENFCHCDALSSIINWNR